MDSKGISLCALMFCRGALEVKKVLLLLVTVLSLVSCRTVTNLSPLEIQVVVPTASSGKVETLETQTIPQEPAIIAEPIVENVLEEFASQTANQLEKGIATVYATEGSYKALEESTEEVKPGAFIGSDKETPDVQESTETTHREEVSSSSDIDVQVSGNEGPKDIVTIFPEKKDESSLINKLKALFLREKLFWFGVLTIVLGIILLVIALIRDVLNACRCHSKKNAKKTSTKNKKAKESDIFADEETQKDENSSTKVALDDDEAFLRSLLDK